MSWFRGGSSTSPAADARLTAAKIEMEMMTDLFNKMSSVCQRKCIASVREAELHVGEMSCIDRCVGCRATRFLGACTRLVECFCFLSGVLLPRLF